MLPSQSDSRERRPDGRCGICGRLLADWRTCAPDDPAMDCGGDCFCIREFERAPDDLTLAG